MQLVSLKSRRPCSRFVRRVEMENRISHLHTADAKEREIRKYTKTESQHLRLRRTKIKLSDFRTVKVIGKGAFGEVCPSKPTTTSGCSFIQCRFVWYKRWILG